MRIPASACLLLALCLPALRAFAAEDTVADTAADLAARQQPAMVQWRRDFHRHPELGGHEVRTAEVVARELRALGLTPRTGIAHTGVTAVLKGALPGPRIALRADMDALPVREETGLPFASTATSTYRGQPVGVMHACGHDMHVAILLGVARALAARRDRLHGEAMFVFQPSEEGPDEAGAPFGAKLMLDEGVWKEFVPEAVFGLHVWAGLPVGQVGFRSGPLLAAADEWTLNVHGRQTHGSRPWDGVDPITIGAQVLLATQSLVARQVNIASTPVVLTAGQFNSGVRFNIIPDDARLVGTLRTFDPAVRADVIARFERIARDYAHAAGGSATLAVASNAPVTVNDPALARRVWPSLRTAVGAENAVEMPLVTVAEDFAQFAGTVPGAYFFVGSTPADRDPATSPINHSPQYAPDEAALEIGARAMLQVALDYLEGAGAGG